MRKLVKKIGAATLAAVMTFSIMPQMTLEAGTALNSTETVDDPAEESVNADVYFVHASSKRVVTLNGVENDPIDCVNTITENNIPENGRFTIYYGEFGGKEVVNFTCDATNTSWKADNDNVFQMAKRTNPGGWESVVMEPQGDGTVAFKSSANGKYFTVNEFKLELTDETSLSGNEKFVIHTTTEPKAAKKITLSEVSGESVKVSWEGVNETLYSGYQVLYSTKEDGEYTVAGQTKDTSFTVSNLTLSTTYYFKVRTVTNDEGGPFKDSAIAYTKTLSDYKPAAPKNIQLTSNEDQSIKLDWEASKSAKGYIIYRADSRFGEYQEIGNVNGITTFTDTNPNLSKYNNYYKIKAYNDVDESTFSEEISIEITMFGRNTYIFTDKDSAEDINKITSTVFEQQHYNQFGTERYALAYKPGDYTGTDTVNIGYYTQIMGLGKTPTEVKLSNVKTPSALSENNATCNFWVSIENLTIADLDNIDDRYYDFQWAVSQAAPARRLNVERTAVFDWYWGWASGGYVADSRFMKSAGSYSQQQYYYRNCDVANGTYGVNWNQVIQGCTGNTVSTDSMEALLGGEGYSNWNQRGATTVIDSTSKIREKPFLYFDTETESYKVFVPAIRENAKGISWSENDMGEGTSLSVEKTFYIANPEKDTADTINAQLFAGKNIIFQPGVYHVEKPLEIKKENTIILGLGLATIIPDNSDTAMRVSDVGGVSISGIIFDAGKSSETLLTIGNEGCNKDHSENPVVLQDIFYRVGGTGSLGTCGSCLVINSNDVIVDHTWIWRADHGNNTGWYANTAKNGMVVNGDNITVYGLFCEHFQEYDILWRGENGKTYFLQNEKCYDPQSQEGWMSHEGTVKGYAAYKVANNVTNHYAVGLGVYDVFINTNGASIFLENAIEVPDAAGVLIENACIVEIANGSGPKVGINHIINGTTAGIRTGAEANGGYAIQRLLSYTSGNSLSLEDYYTNSEGTSVIPEVGVAPETDGKAEKEIEKDAPSKDTEIPLWNMTDEKYQERIEVLRPEPVEETTTSEDVTKEKETTAPEGETKEEEATTSEKITKEESTTYSGATAEKETTVSQTTGNITPVIKKNQKLTIGKLTYRVTKVKGKNGTLKITGVNKKYIKKLKRIVIKTKLNYKGYTFKVTVIQKKAFAKTKKLKRIVVKGKNLTKVSKNAFRKKAKITVKANKKIKKLFAKALKN